MDNRQKNSNFLVYLKHGVFSLYIDTIRKFRRHNCGKIFKNRIRIQNARESTQEKERKERKREKGRKKRKKQEGGRERRREEGKEKRGKKERKEREEGMEGGGKRRMLPVHISDFRENDLRTISGNSNSLTSHVLHVI